MPAIFVILFLPSQSSVKFVSMLMFSMLCVSVCETMVQLRLSRCMNDGTHSNLVAAQLQTDQCGSYTIETVNVRNLVLH